MGPTDRQQLSFSSGDADCVAWFYPGGDGACVLMAAGVAVTTGPGTDRFANRFQAAGYAVLAFDYRRFGRSGGEPRQVLRVRDQHQDWDAAIRFAATVPGVDPTRLALWGASISGGHVVAVAARHPELAAVVAQSPNLDGPAAARNAARHQTVRGLLATSGVAIRDVLAGTVGGPVRRIPLDGPPGSVALLTTPDARHGRQALDPEGRYPEWQPEVSARSLWPLMAYRPGRHAARVRCPLLVVMSDDDRSALTAPAISTARRAPRGKLVRLPGGHYSPYGIGHDAAVNAEIGFLDRHLRCAVDDQDPQGVPSGSRT